MNVKRIIKSLLLGKINPYALLATHLGFRPDIYPIFISEKGEKYVLTAHGFVPVERYNAQVQYDELNKEYKLLLNQHETVVKTLSHEQELSKSLRTLQESTESLLKSTEKELEALKKGIADEKQIPFAAGKKLPTYQELQKELKSTRAMLLTERELTNNLRTAKVDALGKRKRSQIKKVLGSTDSDADKLSQIKKFIE